MPHIHPYGITRRINSPAVLFCRHALPLLAILGMALPIPCLAQTPPAASQPIIPINTAAIALAKLPRYTAAPVPNADRGPDTYITLVALQRVAPQFSLDAVPLKAALDRLAQNTGLNFSVEWTALAKVGIQRDEKISLTLKNVTYHKILTLLLASLPAAPGQDPPAYQVKDGVVVVSTQAVLDGRREFAPYTLRTEVAVFFNSNIPDARQDQESADLMAVIQHNIAPSDWKAGKDTIENFHNTFIVTAPARIQEQIAQFLADVQSPARLPKAPAFLVQSPAGAAAYKNLLRPFAGGYGAMPLGDALKQLQAAGNFNLFVDWRALAAGGITPDTPTSIPLQNPPIGAALQAALQGAHGKTGAADFSLDDEGVLTISATADLAAQTALGVYDLRDWIKHEQFIAYRDKPTAEQLMNAVIESLKKAIAPDSWGKTASIENFHGLLIINATAKNHRAILEQLAKLVKL